MHTYYNPRLAFTSLVCFRKRTALNLKYQRRGGLRWKTSVAHSLSGWSVSPRKGREPWPIREHHQKDRILPDCGRTCAPLRNVENIALILILQRLVHTGETRLWDYFQVIRTGRLTGFRRLVALHPYSSKLKSPTSAPTRREDRPTKVDHAMVGKEERSLSQGCRCMHLAVLQG